jgi:hypothetical protein
MVMDAVMRQRKMTKMRMRKMKESEGCAGNWFNKHYCRSLFPCKLKGSSWCILNLTRSLFYENILFCCSCCLAMVLVPPEMTPSPVVLWSCTLSLTCCRAFEMELNENCAYDLLRDFKCGWTRKEAFFFILSQAIVRFLFPAQWASSSS